MHFYYQSFGNLGHLGTLKIYCFCTWPCC